LDNKNPEPEFFTLNILLPYLCFKKMLQNWLSGIGEHAEDIWFGI
jgi:hypothetical protein